MHGWNTERSRFCPKSNSFSGVFHPFPLRWIKPRERGWAKRAYMSERKSAVQWVPRKVLTFYHSHVNCMEVLRTRYLPRRRKNQFLTTPIRKINALHCTSASLYWSSIYNKTALLFHENNNFIRKTDLCKWTVLFPILSFKSLVHVHAEETCHG